MTHDLTFVAPERRAEVRRRIEVIERFISSPGRKAAEQAAEELGIRVAQFYNLVRAWRISRRPEDVTSGGSPRHRRSQMSEAQLALVASAIAANPRGTPSEIVDDILARSRDGTVEVPARGALLRYVRHTRPSLLPADAGGAELIVDHTVVDLPVIFAEIPKRPLVTAVIDVADDAIVGMALSDGPPNPATTAAALLDAIRHSLHRHQIRPAEPLRIRLLARTAAETDGIAALLNDLGIDVQVTIVGAHEGGRHVEALLGSRRAGIQLRPRLVWNTGTRRSAPMSSASKAITPRMAAELVRGRLMPARASSQLGRLDDASRIRLVPGLARIAQESGVPG